MKRRYRGEKLPAPKNGSAKLKKIVLKACEYNPEDRYASAQEMYDDLDTLRSGEVTGETVKKVKPEDVSFDDGKTGGNSWRDDPVTIGKTPGKTPKTGKSNFQDEPEKKTEGVKDAYKRQKEKEKKKERTTVVADVPVQAKKKSFELWKNVAILVFIVLIGYEFFIADGNLTKSSSSTGNSKYETKEEYYDDAETKLKTETRYKDGTIYDQDIYNEDGTKQKSVSYDKNGNIDHEFQYNAEGQRYKSISYDENGEIAYYSESEYNENGDEIKSTGYRANGSVQSITERQLLEDGTVVERTDTTYDENGNITSKRVLECDDKGNSMKDSHYDANGTLCNYETYAYDDSGNSIGGTYYTKDGAAYAYWRYKGDGAFRESVQYDTDGNEISLSELFEIKSEVGATF